MEHGILFKDSRVIVPESMHPKILEIVHQGQQSQEKCLLHVTETFLAWKIQGNQKYCGNLYYLPNHPRFPEETNYHTG